MANDGLTLWGAGMRLGDLSEARSYHFEITPKAEEMSQIAQDLDLSALRKLSFKGTLSPVGKRDWQLTATLGATVVQPCVATLAPVTTRIDTEITRRYLHDLKEEYTAEEEVEIPEDDNSEPLPAELRLSTVAIESLALATPDYPRAEGASVDVIRVTEPGKEAMTDEEAKPFAVLQALKDKLGKEED